MDRLEEILAYLSNCSGGEFAETINEVLKRRKENESTEYEDCRLVLAQAVREKVAEDKWEISLIAGMNKEYYSIEWLKLGEPFYQHGECTNCKVNISSHVKSAICPLCFSEVSCT